MFRASNQSVTIEVTCENSTIEIKSLKNPFLNSNRNAAIEANEKALLLSYLIERQGSVSEEELRS